MVRLRACTEQHFQRVNASEIWDDFVAKKLQNTLICPAYNDDVHIKTEDDFRHDTKVSIYPSLCRNCKTKDE